MIRVVIALVVLTSPVQAQDAQQTCAKMRAEDRLGPVSEASCNCRYRVADAVLDDDIKVLLFDSWYSGANNMAQVEKLKPRSRVKKQFRTLARSFEANCG